MLVSFFTTSLLLSLSAVATASTVPAIKSRRAQRSVGGDKSSGYSSVVVFGDSFSDNGQYILIIKKKPCSRVPDNILNPNQNEGEQKS